MNTNMSSSPSDTSANTASSSSTAGMYSGAETSSQHSAGMGEQSGSSLRSELSSLKADLDALMAHASTLTDHELREARDRIAAKFSSMRYAAKGLADQASKQLTHGVDVTSDYVKERPLQSVAIAAGVGLLIGALLRRG